MPGPVGETWTYEVYRAGSQSAALELLRFKAVALPNYYTMVETPEGSFGRDVNSIFQE